MNIRDKWLFLISYVLMFALNVILLMALIVTLVAATSINSQLDAEWRAFHNEQMSIVKRHWGQSQRANTILYGYLERADAEIQRRSEAKFAEGFMKASYAVCVVNSNDPTGCLQSSRQAYGEKFWREDWPGWDWQFVQGLGQGG